MALVPKSGTVIFQKANDGAQEASRQLAQASGRPVIVSYMPPSEAALDAQEAKVRTAIDTKTDGIILSCVEDGISGLVNQAVDQHVPVITFDSECPNSEQVAFYSMDNWNAGSKGAELLAKAMKSMGDGPKQVAILSGSRGSVNLEERIAGFKERLIDEFRDVQVRNTYYCGEDDLGCETMIENDILETPDDVDGLFLVGLWGIQNACGLCEKIDNCSCDNGKLPRWRAATKSKLKTVAFDTLPFEVILLKEGYLSALIGQKYFNWGYCTVSYMYDHITQRQGVHGFVDSGFDVVDNDNVDDMLSKWQAGEPVPDCDPRGHDRDPE